MRTYDLSPLFRSSVGFDRLARMLDGAPRVDEATGGYPPYNIEKRGEEAYRVTMAVAGFAPDDIEISVHENVLTVTGRGREVPAEVQFLYRGIAGRAFERRFQLADHIKVAGANLTNGLLDIDLVREVPEAMKPRTITINAGRPSTSTIFGQQAA